MKNPILQSATTLLAIVAVFFLMSYTKPAAAPPKQYILVRGATFNQLENNVNEKLGQGWELQGGVSVIGTSAFQAMAK